MPDEGKAVGPAVPRCLLDALDHQRGRVQMYDQLLAGYQAARERASDYAAQAALAVAAAQRGEPVTVWTVYLQDAASINARRGAIDDWYYRPTTISADRQYIDEVVAKQASKTNVNGYVEFNVWCYEHLADDQRLERSLTAEAAWALGAPKRTWNRRSSDPDLVPQESD